MPDDTGRFSIYERQKRFVKLPGRGGRQRGEHYVFVGSYGAGSGFSHRSTEHLAEHLVFGKHQIQVDYIREMNDIKAETAVRAGGAIQAITGVAEVAFGGPVGWAVGADQIQAGLRTMYTSEAQKSIVGSIGHAVGGDVGEFVAEVTAGGLGGLSKQAIKQFGKATTRAGQRTIIRARNEAERLAQSLDNLRNGPTPLPAGVPIDNGAGILSRTGKPLPDAQPLPTISNGEAGLGAASAAASQAPDIAEALTPQSTKVDKMVNVAADASDEIRNMSLKGWKKGKGGPHFEKHGSSMGFPDQKAYTDAAKDLAAKSENVIERKIGNIIFKYDEVTQNILIVNAKDRVIKTFHQAHDGVKSFEKAMIDHKNVLDNVTQK